jgi:hypothetical protein
MRAYALVSVIAPDEAADVLRREDAEAALVDCLRDQPDWVDLVTVVPIELDGARHLCEPRRGGRAPAEKLRRRSTAGA